MREFFSAVPLEAGGLVALGMSSSEIAGRRIGSASAPEIGARAVGAVIEALSRGGFPVAVQCCEHLNRALVVERGVALRLGLTEVSAVPYPEAGGSAAAAAWRLMDEPVLVQSVRAKAGIDVGVTMIGMHIEPVAVPVRTALTIGGARVDFAYSRPKLIGGERARYS